MSKLFLQDTDSVNYCLTVLTVCRLGDLDVCNEYEELDVKFEETKYRLAIQVELNES